MNRKLSINKIRNNLKNMLQNKKNNNHHIINRAKL